MDTFNEATGPFAPEYTEAQTEAQIDGVPSKAWFETDLATPEVSEWEQQAFDDNMYLEEEWKGDLEVRAPFSCEDRRTDPMDAHESAGPRPTLRRGSRGAEVKRAQTLLNDFLRRIASGPQECVDRSTARMARMQSLLFSLRRQNQLPLKVDGVFGPNTENATQLFQLCLGLVRDGIIGNVTWRYLEQNPSHGPRRRNPPDTAGCGVPERPSAEFEAELDLELEMLGETRRPAMTAVSPALSLFQNSSITSHRNHFHCQASRIARMLRAYANPRVDQCTPWRVGPTAYDTGADIIAAITAASACLKRPISSLHIVGHSASYGAFGATRGSDGIYIEADPVDRATGARAIADIPVDALASNVVVVLHGCNQGSGSDSFAEMLYRHLAAFLTSPVVFAHPNQGCAGRDNSWRRFDGRSPAGRSERSIAPHYSGHGCCTPGQPSRETEGESAWSGESQIVPSSAWGNKETILNGQWESSPEHEPAWKETGLEASRRPCGCGQ
ncbi:peptidoglycan-binding domain-containing protein [Arthrobacter sp. MDT1-65]